MPKGFVDFQSKTLNPEHRDVHDVAPEEVLAKKSEVCLIDVRRPDEFEGELGHIPGAELLTLDYLPMQISQLPKDKTMVIVCRSGNRSGHAAAFLVENGFTSVFNMKGGMILWNELGLVTEGRDDD
ncbi:MAG: rhodanese-like domain-containing protein [Bdellovibrionales bacterium]|nr:rhodanese-like domain-containing protein [Bdellovibrionales bacterium]